MRDSTSLEPCSVLGCDVFAFRLEGGADAKSKLQNDGADTDLESLRDSADVELLADTDLESLKDGSNL